jgi:hypothetical protein
MTTHSTVVRFKQEAPNAVKFLNLLEKYREFDFGSFEIICYELIYNDLCPKKELNTPLHQFKAAN